MQRHSLSTPLASAALLALLATATASAAQDEGAVTAQEPAAQTADMPPGAVPAIWKQQEISFNFVSFTTRYACTSLESRVERLLKELGAQAKVRVHSPDCPWRVATFPRVVVEVISPVEATPEAIAERDKNKSTRELVARVQGRQLEDATPFPAQWKPVSLSRGKLQLEPGDCELIDELKRKVLPKLAVRIVKEDVSCTPHQLSIQPPRLQLEALVALPKPDQKEAPKPEKLELNLRTE